MPLESFLGRFQVFTTVAVVIGLSFSSFFIEAFNPLLFCSPKGTLHPNCQDSSGRPRRDISTILQILNDLLSATRHYQGMPASLTQLRYQTQCGGAASPAPSPPPSPPVTAELANLSSKATSVPSVSQAPLHPLVQCQSQVRMCKPPGE